MALAPEKTEQGQRRVSYFFAKRPLMGNKDIECGDTVVVKEFDGKLFLGIVDVLGHGQNAHELAIVCHHFLEKNYQKDLLDILSELHEHIKSTGGTVAALGLLDVATGNLRYIGVGNTVARKFGRQPKRLISREGVLGYVIRTLREETLTLEEGDVLILYTDGVREHFELEDYPDLLEDSVQTVVENIMTKFGKDEDDAACLALRYERIAHD